MPENVFNKLDNTQVKAKAIEENIEIINSELESLSSVLRNLNDNEEIYRIKLENERLIQDVKKIKQELFFTEIMAGIRQTNFICGTKEKETTPSCKESLPCCNVEKLPKIKPELASINIPSNNYKTIQTDANDDVLFEKAVQSLDFCVGLVISAEKHPDADTLYVETVDTGDSSPRTIVSGLVAHISLDQFINRKVVVLCNLKPAKLRGVLSQGMLMCAVEGDKCELLEPPSSSQPGDRIIFDSSTLPIVGKKEIKKDIFAKFAHLLKTSPDCIAQLGNRPFLVEGEKGPVKCSTLKGTTIR